MVNSSLPLLDNIISNLKMITEDIVIKYNSQASKYETIAYTKAFDYYYLALNNMDSFDTYPSFCEEALRMSGINVDKELRECLSDKKNIPEGVRNAVVINQRMITVRDFEEKNDYYRQYIGLPNTNDTVYFYVDEDTSEQTGISTDIPIHKLSVTDISILSGVGFIGKLIDENPDKLYLKYLGTNKLDLYRIRKANNLSIIKIKKLSAPDKLFEEFMTCYEQSRTYFINAIFIKEYAAIHEYYENIMAFLIMVNSIKMLMTRIFKNGIDRDFYDLISIVKMFDAYNIPYVREFTLEQQRIILRNINNLIRIKSTDKVLIEICSLLGMGDIDIFRYYLVKTHKRDEATGKPIFKYKKNNFGETVLDKENMYNVHFSKVDINDTNIGLALNKSKNFLDYKEVTEGDPFWWEDDELKESIYENEFNFIETKYISFQLMYKMSSVIFEEIYFLSLLHDRKEETSKIKLLFPKLDFKNEISLFDSCILLFALMAKRTKMKGEIIYQPTQVANVLGFNFNLDLKPILDDIRNDSRIYDEELINYVTGMSLSTAQDVNTLYSKIKGFRKYIEEKMFYCTDKDVYMKYKTIYKTFMTTDTMGQLFRLPDGDIASTYKEYLMYSNYDLYRLVDMASDRDIMDMITHIISKLEEYCTSLEYLHYVGTDLDSTINAIWTLINFFKSYTVDVNQFNIIFLIDDRFENTLKLLEYVTFKVGNELRDDNDGPITYDTLKYRANLYDNDKFKFRCRTQVHSYLQVDDMLIIKTIGDDSIKLIKSRCFVGDGIDTIDTTANVDIIIDHDENLPIRDVYKYFNNLYLDASIPLNDKVKVIYETSMDDVLKISDEAKYVIRIYKSDNFELNEHTEYCCTIYTTDESIDLEEVIDSKIRLFIEDEASRLYDTLSVHGNLKVDSTIGMHDKIKIVYN